MYTSEINIFLNLLSIILVLIFVDVKTVIMVMLFLEQARGRPIFLIYHVQFSNLSRAIS